MRSRNCSTEPVLRKTKTADRREAAIIRSREPLFRAERPNAAPDLPSRGVPISHHMAPRSLFTPGNQRATVLPMLPLQSSRPLRNSGLRQRKIRNRFILGLIATALGAGLAPHATAHGRSVSYSNWEIDSNRAIVTFRVKLLELSRLGPQALPPGVLSGFNAPDAPDLSARRFPTDLVLIANDRLCASDPVAERRPDQPGWVRYEWRIECPPEADSLLIRSRVLLDVSPSHLHFARVRFAENPDRDREQVLTEASPNFEIRRAGNDTSPKASSTEFGASLADYLRLGIEHILTGWDHLAFVFGLLLLASRFGEVARLITGFTLAHSLTLALAVQGLVHPRAAAVEAVIAFSVALVAIEKGWLVSSRNRAVPIAVLVGLVALGIASRMGWASLPLPTIAGLVLFTACYFSLAGRSSHEWLRICLTFAFGLVHGFGFAGVLVEMALPTDRLVPALVGFNLGVELGQIGIILVLWPLLHFGSHFASNETKRLTSEISAASLCGLGLYWLVERVFPL
jgi:hypothetical protein